MNTTLVRRHPPLELTDDPDCSYEEREGGSHPNACKRHDWSYRLWFENLRTGTSK